MDIQFNIDTACNLNCKYCNSRGFRIFKTPDVIKTINSLFRVYAARPDDKEHILYFHGGEASFHRDVVPILQYIARMRKIFRPRNFAVEFQTNLSLELAKYIEIGKCIDAFSISVHYQELKRKGLLDRFASNLDAIAGRYAIYNLDIMLENVDDVDAFHRYILDRVYKHAKAAKHCEMIYGFYGFGENDEAYEKNIEFYKKYNLTERTYQWPNMPKPKTTNELFAGGYNCKGMVCEAGVSGFNVFGNGDVYRCAAHAYNSMEREKLIHHYGPHKPLFNIKDGITELLEYTKTARECQWLQCNGDFYIPRYYKK